MSNFYHKQSTPPPRHRRDRVVVIDSATKPVKSPANNPDIKQNQNVHQNFKMFVIVVVFMLGVLFLSIKLLEYMWTRRDQSIVQSISKTPIRETPAVLSPVVQVDAPPTPPPPIGKKSENPATNEKDEVETIYRWGKVLEEAGEYDGALARYREALDIAPDNVVVLSQMGRLNIQLAHYGDAVTVLKTAIQYSSDNPDIMNDLGVAMTFNNQAAEAVELYDQLMEKFPDYLPALFNKGYALVQLHDYEKARPLLEAYIEKKSDDAMALGVLAVLELSEKNHDQALALLDRAIAAAPTWSTPYLDAASVCASIDKPEKALNYLERALEFTSPEVVYQQFQNNSFRAIRLTEVGKAFEKKIADRARQTIK